MYKGYFRQFAFVVVITYLKQPRILLLSRMPFGRYWHI